jgi:hypothetical protein
MRAKDVQSFWEKESGYVQYRDRKKSSNLENPAAKIMYSL